jgi:hypothetical protein
MYDCKKDPSSGHFQCVLSPVGAFPSLSACAANCTAPVVPTPGSPTPAPPMPTPAAPTPGPPPTSGCSACTSSGKSWCYKDGQCHAVGSVFNPCSCAQCCASNPLSSCSCKSCSDASCSVVTLEVAGSKFRSDLMGSYVAMDKSCYGRTAYVQQQPNGANYLYWLPLHVQWVIGSPLGYNLDPWMFVNDDVPSPDHIKNTWYSRPKSSDHYQQDTSVAVTRAAALGPQQLHSQYQVATW